MTELHYTLLGYSAGLLLLLCYAADLLRRHLALGRRRTRTKPSDAEHLR
jgi:hypothetical protein